MDIAALVVRVDSSEIPPATRSLSDLTQIAGTAERAARRLGEESTTAGRAAAVANDNVARSAHGAANAYASLFRVLGAVGIALGVGQIVNMASAWTDLQARVQNTIGPMGNAAGIMDRLSEIADRTYSSLSLTAETFLLNNSVLADLGKSTQEALDYTEALNNALVVSGAKGEVAASVQTALSRAMALGKLQGDQLNTVIDRGGRVAELLAAELGVTRNELRELGRQGLITGEVIYNALVGNFELLRAEAEAMPATIQDGFLLIQNALMRFIGTRNEAAGAGNMIAGVLRLIAQNIGIVVIAVTALALRWGIARLAGSAFGQAIAAATGQTIAMTRAVYVLSGGSALLATRFAAATVAAGALNAALRFFGGPIGLAITAVAVGVGLWATRTREATDSLAAHEAMVEDVRAAYQRAQGDVTRWAEEVQSTTASTALANMQATIEEYSAARQSFMDAALYQLRDRSVREGMELPLGQAIRRMVVHFGEGTMSAEAFRDSLDFIALSTANLEDAASRQLHHVATTLLSNVEAGAALEEIIRELILIVTPFKDDLNDASRAAYDHALELYGIADASLAAEVGINGVSGAAANSVGNLAGATAAARELASVLTALGNISVPNLGDRALAAAQLERGLAAIDQRQGSGANAGASDYVAMLERTRLYAEYEEALTRIAQREATERSDLIIRESQRATAAQLEGVNRAIFEESLRHEENMNFLRERGAAETELLEMEQLHRANLEAINRQYADMATGSGSGGTVSGGMRDVLALGQQRIDQLQEEMAVLGMATAEAAAYRLERELINAATAEGIALSATDIAAIGQVAAAYGQASAQLEAMQAAQQKSLELMDTLKSTTREFLGTFLSGLREGRTAMEALDDSLGRLADRLLDMALDAAINMLFKNLLGAFGGAVGGLSSGASFIPGYGYGGLFGDGGFLGAGKWGIAGERDPEIVRGPATIQPIGAATAANTNVNVEVNLINAPAGTTVGSQRQRVAGNGQVIVDLVLDTVKSGIEGGRFDQPMSKRYGMRPGLSGR